MTAGRRRLRSGYTSYTAPANGSATITWEEAPLYDIATPTVGEGGATMSDLTGYKVYKSSTSTVGPWTLVNTVANPATLTSTVTSLTSGVWYFGVASYDSSGNIGPINYAGTKTI
jgi:hypothetical protein